MALRENISHETPAFESDRKLMAPSIVIGARIEGSVRWHECRGGKIKITHTIRAVIFDILDGFRSRTDCVPMDAIVCGNHQACVDVGGYKDVR